MEGAITVTGGFDGSTTRTSLELQQEALHPNAEMDTAMQNSSIFKISIKTSKALVIGSLPYKKEYVLKTTLTTPIMLAAAANTELIVFRLRLLMTRLFVVFTPAAIDRDPETMNITGPQIGACKATEMSDPKPIVFITITPKLRFMRAIITCTTPKTLGSPFKNFSLFSFHLCDFITDGSEG